MKPNYAMLLDFLTKRNNIQGKELARQLHVDPATISKIKANKRNMIPIDPETFYEAIFSRKGFRRPDLTDDYHIRMLYDDLKEKNRVTPKVQEAYLAYCQKEGVDQTERAKEFLLLLLLETSYEKEDPAAKPEAALQTEPAVLAAPQPAFARFINPIRNNVFFGREDIFEKIRELLTQSGICILSGIGGMGKSYCSLKYAELYADRYAQIQQVFFSSDIRSTILKIPFDGLDESHCGEDEKLEKRFSLLASFSEDTLLIIDNMDTKPRDRENYERLKKLPIHVLFTTREKEIDAGKYQIPIEPLSRQEQLELFRHFCEFEISPDQLPVYYRLFEMVEGHTLLLELISKTMSSSDVTPAEMMEILSNTADEEIDKVSIEKDNTFRQEKMNHFVSKLFDTSGLEERPRNLLMHLSLASVGGIRRKLFCKYLECSVADINSLINQSWIIKVSQSGPESTKIHLHPVIRSAVIYNTEPSIEKCGPFLSRIVRDLTAKERICQEVDVADLCDILINARTMFRFCAAQLDFILLAADILWDHVLYAPAYEYCRLGISLARDAIEVTAGQKVSLYQKAGQIAVRLADYESAVLHYKTAISILEGQSLDDAKSLALLYDDLGSVMRKSSKYEEALAYLTRAQTIIETHHVDAPELTANIYNDMGVIYINLHLYDEAMENYRKGLEIRENAAFPDKKQIAYSYHNIGTVYQRQGKFAQAIRQHKKALEIRREVYPSNEPILASSLTMIGNDYTEAAHQDQNYDFQDAKPYFEEGLAIRKTTLGENHPDTAWSYYSIGRWYFYQGKYREALDYYGKCLAIRQTVLGEGHAYTADILFAIGETYFALRDADGAREFLSRALSIQKLRNHVRACEKTAALLKQL